MAEADQVIRPLESRLVIVDMHARQLVELGIERLQPDDDRHLARLVDLDQLLAERQGRTQKDDALDLFRHQHVDEIVVLGQAEARLHQDDRIAATDDRANAVEDLGKQPAADLVDNHQDDIGLAAPKGLGQRVRAEIDLLDDLAHARQGLLADLVRVVEASRNGCRGDTGQPGDFDDRGASQ